MAKAKTEKRKKGSTQVVIAPQGGGGGSLVDVNIAGRKFKMKRLVTMPLLRHEVGQTRYIKIGSEFYTGKQVDKTKGAATLANVINLEDGKEYNYIVSAVLQKNVEEQYPDGKYVGKDFAVLKMAPPEGKRYSLFHIAEIEED